MADRYIQDYNVDPTTVTYIILSPRKRNPVVFRVSGQELTELIEDEKDALYPPSEEYYEPYDDIAGGYV